MSKQTSVGWYQLLLQYLQDAGFDSQAINSQAAIDATNSDLVGVAQDNMTQLWDIAQDETNDPLLGLKVGDNFRPGPMGIVSWAMMSSATVGESIDILLNHQHLLANALDFSIHEHEKYVEIVLNNIGDKLPASPLSIDASIMSFFTFFRWLTKDNIHFDSVYLNRADFTYKNVLSIKDARRIKDSYQQKLGCRVRLQQGRNSVWIKTSELPHRLLIADPQVHNLHLNSLASAAKERLQGDFRNMVIKLIRQYLGVDNFNVEFIASKLHISKSTLLRTLKAEKTNFQKLLDETRTDMAISLLRHSKQPLAQIADSLGFANANSFCRSFKRLTGNSPGDYRKLVPL